MEKLALYEEKIKTIANSNIPDKHEKLAETLTEYYKYCCSNGYKDNIDIFELGPLSYIIESSPLIFDLNENDVANAFIHLQEVIANNQNGLVDGISNDEAKLILDWVIQNTRKSFQNTEKDLNTASLNGLCGYAQSLTLLPLMEANLEVTINNVESFPSAKHRHAFGTVKIPIKENNQVYYKQVLLDASYRQFFTTVECNEGRYYLQNFSTGPAAGYYVCKTEEGRQFATTLLKHGYIELTPQNAKIYGSGFEYESLTISELEKQIIIKETKENVYIDTINSKQEELDYDKEELEADGDIIVPPGLNDYRSL